MYVFLVMSFSVPDVFYFSFQGKIEAARLKDFSKADVVAFYRKYISPASPTRTTFKLKLYCNKFPQPATVPEVDTTIYITDARQFQADTPKHTIYYSPSAKPDQQCRF
jgi:hypothetical protein